MKIASIITTCNRPQALAKSLPMIEALGDPVLVVSDGYPLGWQYGGSKTFGLSLSERRGLAAAMNIGLSYWLADPSITHISYFQDDVEVDPLLHEVAKDMMKHYPNHVFTGNDGTEHPRTQERMFPSGMEVWEKKSCRGVQMFASRESWEKVMPLPSRGLGLPGKTASGKWSGSGVDWWIVRDSPMKRPVICVPGLARIFLWEGKDSSWNNTSKAGPDVPLNRDSIKGWLQAREVSHARS